MIKKKKRNICIVVASRANYGRVKYLMKAIKEHPDLNLQLILGASILLERFGKGIDIIKKDGFTPFRSIYFVVEGENLITQAKSTGLGIVELATAFEDLNPDMVVTVADRYETMATAISSSYLNIPLVHLQGGDVSGNIDNKVRNAISNLADIHFPASDASAKKLVSMGTNEKNIFNFGCPSMDILFNSDLTISNEIMKSYTGVGRQIDWTKPYLLVLQHPVTTSYGDGFSQITETLLSLKKIPEIQKIVMWPNIDAGSDDVSKGIRHFREFNMDDNIYYHKNFSPEDYARVLNNSICNIGNSSSFIREGACLGVPAVIVGDRQKGRETGNNIMYSSYDSESILKKIMEQFKNGRYKPDKRFGSGNSGKLIADKLADFKLNFKGNSS